MALQFLYQLEVRKEEVIPELGDFLSESDPEESVRQFARQLIEGIISREKEIDRILSDAACNWELKRMAVIDRLVLRLGAYEILYCSETPPAVVINEAVELAKKFSTVASGAFVNGILDSILRSKVS